MYLHYQYPYFIPSPFSLSCCTSMIFRFIVFFILVLVTSNIFIFSSSSNDTDHQALLSFKASIIDDPSRVTASWNSSIHFCHWAGVTCSHKRQRVTELDLSSQNLVGTLTSYIGNLSFLRSIYLGGNKLHGSIPNDIGRLFRLQYLNLSYNSFQGGFPTNLSHCVDIRNISMYGNHLEGKLPTEFSSWSKPNSLNLGNNHFTGSISPSIGNISSFRIILLFDNNLKGEIPNEIGRLFRLQYLALANNTFEGRFPANLSHCVDLEMIDLSHNNLEGKLPTDEFASWPKLFWLDLGTNHFTGPIPPSIGNISSLHLLDLHSNNLVGGILLEIAHHTKLEHLYLDTNHLRGMVPPSLYNISSLSIVNLNYNVLEGTLPSDLGFTLPRLQEFYVEGNRFSGQLPSSIANASNLVTFAIFDNNITGPIPNFGNLFSLKRLVLAYNPLGDNQRPDDLSFFNSLINCTHLQYLGLSQIGLRGKLPNSIVNLSTSVDLLYLDGNYIYGSIPHEIRKLMNLRTLALSSNLLTGIIPGSIGELSKLGGLDLGNNNISGVIPTTINSNITQLVVLSLERNWLQGSIPAELFNISTLEKVSLAENRLTGVIPNEIGFLSNCVFINLSQNLFSGPLPSNIGNMKHLGGLDLSYNQLTGDIPATFDGCLMLETLYMVGNLFQGEIPSSFEALKNLAFLDLSNNNISGSIPRFFDGFLHIVFLNLSHNRFVGEVSKIGPFSNVSTFSVMGNLDLCGGIQALHLPACHENVSRKKKKAFGLIIILILVLVPLSMLLACLALISYRRRNSKKLNEPVVLKDDQYPKLSYQDLLLATNEFSPNNMLGEGRYGSVYKGVLDSLDQTVAVKVLNVEIHGANKTFLVECETLRNIRHRNLIKIITACSSIDFKGNDFKALVFELMTNGSVDNWLHPSPSNQGKERNLTLLQRLNISIDVALGLDYLHHHGHTRIIHSDIKPSNILLDEDFVAHIGDFGLARFSFATTNDVNQGKMSSTSVHGTVGYVPPEYGMCAEISTEGDVYSYGILLLEMFSGKRPTERSILMDGGSNLHDYVRMALPQRVMDIADPRILLNQEENGMTINQSCRRATMEVCLTSIFEVGILCSEENPRKRIEMSDAIKQLHVARDKLLRHRQ